MKNCCFNWLNLQKNCDIKERINLFKESQFISQNQEYTQSGKENVTKWIKTGIAKKLTEDYALVFVMMSLNLNQSLLNVII